MIFLYLTADQIGTPTGGGAVTFNESEALRSLGPCNVYGRERIQSEAAGWWGLAPEPWKWDEGATYLGDHRYAQAYKLAHIYSGTFSRTVQKLKESGTKVCYTIAAHRVADSRRAFEDLGLQYDFPHLTDREQWKRYSAGYFAADVIVCPSTHSRDVVQEQARELGVACPRIEVIPHGCTLPEKVAPLPSGRFTVGYCGAYGPDKGVRYLLEAWKKLDCKDATLVLAGRESTSNWVGGLINKYGGGNISLLGWVENISNFYNGIHLYVQPSATEGFGLEILEAMAHGRPVLCSDHAGAKDLVPQASVFQACDAQASANRIDWWRHSQIKCSMRDEEPSFWRERAEPYTWDNIRRRYLDVWRSLL